MLKSIITRLFPVEAISVVSRNRSTDLEVNGLPKGFLPQNCEILESGEESHGNMRRMHYLTRVGNYVVYLTVCTPEFGDSMFALIRGVGLSDTETEEDVRRYARNAMTMVCAKSSDGPLGNAA